MALRHRTARLGVAFMTLAACVCAADAQVLEPVPPEGAGQDAPAAPARQALKIDRIELPGTPIHLEIDEEGGDLIAGFVQLANGAWMRLVECGETLCAEPSSAHAGELPAGALPGSSVAYGDGRINQAWFADPVSRLDNGALGGTGAATLAIEDSAKTLHKFELPIDEAFEDLMPRLADLDGDGEAEVLAVKTSPLRGSALIAVRLGDVGPVAVAATAPPGVPGSWLNVIGVADFDGNKVPDVALVRSPHGNGQLEILNLSGSGFRTARRLRGFSNHRRGSPAIGMSAIADLDGDKLPDIVVPSANRMALRVISLAKGRVAEPFRIPLAAEVVTEIGVTLSPSGSGLMIVTGLADGSIAVIR